MAVRFCPDTYDEAQLRRGREAGVPSRLLCVALPCACCPPLPALPTLSVIILSCFCPVPALPCASEDLLRLSYPPMQMNTLRIVVLSCLRSSSATGLTVTEPPPSLAGAMRCTLPSLNSCDPVGVSANSVPKEVNIDRTPNVAISFVLNHKRNFHLRVGHGRIFEKNTRRKGGKTGGS